MSRRSIIKARLAADHGAAALESLISVGMLIVMLILVVFTGAGFSNLALMNSAAQSATLTSQFIVDEGCSGAAFSSSGGACGAAITKAYAHSNEIIQEQSQHLMFAPKNPDGTNRAMQTYLMWNGRTNRSNPMPMMVHTPGMSAPTTLPDGGVVGPGWGYSSVVLGTDFHPMGSGMKFMGVNLGLPDELFTGSMTASYRQPR